MAHIYTSYFANSHNFPADTLTIGVTRFPPKDWKGINFIDLAPSEKLLRQYKNKEIDEYIFRILYLRELNSKFSNEEILATLKALSNKDIILCCYEKPTDFCHRHILAEWLGDNINEYEK